MLKRPATCPVFCIFVLFYTVDVVGGLRFDVKNLQRVCPVVVVFY